MHELFVYSQIRYGVCIDWDVNLYCTPTTSTWPPTRVLPAPPSPLSLLPLSLLPLSPRYLSL